MRRLAPCLVIAMLLWSTSVSSARPAAAAAQPAAPQAPTVTYPLPAGVRFLHTASAGTLLGDATLMTNPASDNLPGQLVFATHNWNPGGQGGQNNNRGVGTYYSTLIAGLGPAGIPGLWALYNEDSTSFDEGLAYNIMVTPPSDRAFLHTSSVTNTLGSATYIDSDWLDGRLDRIPFILHNHSPNGVYAGADITAPLAVNYDTLFLKWVIFTEDGSSLPPGVTFNVMVGLPGATVFTHTATVGTLGGNVTFIDHPLANGHPNALVLVTQNYNPDGIGLGVDNNHHVAVFYHTELRQWGIYNEDGADMPLGAGFSVLIDEAQVYLPSVLR